MVIVKKLTQKSQSPKNKAFL